MTKPETKIITKIRTSCEYLFNKKHLFNKDAITYSKYFWLKIPDAVSAYRFLPTKPFDLLILTEITGKAVGCGIEVKATYKKSIPKSRILVKSQLDGILCFDKLGMDFHGFWIIGFIKEKEIALYKLTYEAIKFLSIIETRNEKSFVESEIKTASPRTPVILKRGELIDVIEWRSFRK